MTPERHTTLTCWAVTLLRTQLKGTWSAKLCSARLEFMQLLSQTSLHVGKELLDGETLRLATDLNQVDIIRE